MGGLQTSDGGDDVDLTSPRPEGHYGRFRNSPWYHIDNELIQTSILGPATDTEPGDGWILSFTGEDATKTDHERVCVRPTPRALHELRIEAKDLLPDAQQAGYIAECDLCGESAPLGKAVPNKREEPVRKRYYADACGGLV